MPVRFGFYSVLVDGNRILTTPFDHVWYTSQHAELVGEVPPKRHTSCTVLNNFAVRQEGIPFPFYPTAPKSRTNATHPKPRPRTNAHP